MDGAKIRLEWVDPKTLTDNPLNWRRHPDRQRRALEDALSAVGWAGALLYNERTGRLIDGHLRRDVAVKRNEEYVPVLVGDWSEDEERIILASLDPIAAMAREDTEGLARLLSELGEYQDAVRDVMDFLMPSLSNVYQQEMNVHEYDGGGTAVLIDELSDVLRYRELLAQIDAADGLSEEEREFLRLAATRFIVFDYHKIALYYTRASAAMRHMMEKCALVIVDIDNAIRDGMVRIVRSLRDEYRREYPS